jgi:hypothetical protein
MRNLAYDKPGDREARDKVYRFATFATMTATRNRLKGTVAGTALRPVVIH